MFAFFFKFYFNGNICKGSYNLYFLFFGRLQHRVIRCSLFNFYERYSFVFKYLVNLFFHDCQNYIKMEMNYLLINYLKMF